MRSKRSLWALLLLTVVCGGPFYLVVISVLHVFASAGIAAEDARMMRNMRALTEAALVYVSDSGGRFPPHMESAKAAQPFLSRYAASGEIFHSEDAGEGQIFGNPKLNGVKLDEVADLGGTVLFYCKLHRSDDGSIASFADGTVRKRELAGIRALLEIAPQKRRKRHSP